MPFQDTAAITLSVVVLCLSTLTVGQLVLFLSSHAPLQLTQHTSVADNTLSGGVWWSVGVDMCLVSLFVLQHSLQNSTSVVEFFSKHGLAPFHRLLYNAGACIALQVLMRLWHPIPGWVVWEISTSEGGAAWWLFSVLHALCWLLIYSGCYIMDMGELMGFKQVVHWLRGWPEPLRCKSSGLRRFYSHLRHPSFLALSLVLFVHPLMQADRLLLAHLLVAYVVAGTRVDEADYAYQKRLLVRKERDLHCNE